MRAHKHHEGWTISPNLGSYLKNSSAEGAARQGRALSRSPGLLANMREEEWLHDNSETKTDSSVVSHGSIGVFTVQYNRILTGALGRSTPVAQSAPRNLLTRWDVSSIPANGIFLTKKLKNQNKNAQRVEND